MLVPEASIRVVCLVPSEPVMPWTMTLLSLVRKIDICSYPLLRCQLGGPLGGAVHRVDPLESGQPGLVEDLAALLGVVAVQPDDQRLAHGLAAGGQQLERLDDAVRDRVAGGDAA